MVKKVGMVRISIKKETADALVEKMKAFDDNWDTVIADLMRKK